jgi:transcription antitermination factor NusG
MGGSLSGPNHMEIDNQQFKNSSSNKWFALRVKSRCEKLVANIIRNKGFEEFLPLYRCRRRWSDRDQPVDLPLFPGYLFCHIDPNNRLPLLTIPGAMHFVGIGKVPVAVDEGEICAIQAAVRSGLTIEPWTYLEVGQSVRLEHGPLAGLDGILVEIRKQHRIVVSVTLLRRSIGVEIDRTWISASGSERRTTTCVPKMENFNVC